MAKEGSTISGLMDTLATSVSLALQYGVPLKDVVNKFAHVRFEPSGFTGNPEIPIAKSLVDYIFRWLGSRFLPTEDRAALGLIDRSALVAEAPARVRGLGPRPADRHGHPGPVRGGRRMPAPAPTPEPARPSRRPRPSATAVAAPTSRRRRWPVGELVTIATNGHDQRERQREADARGLHGSLGGSSLGGGAKVSFAVQADAPSCAECGSIMVRNGSCYKCLNCGSTSGCS